MQAVFVLAAYLLAFFVLFNGLRQISAPLGEARRGFETWAALIAYPAVYVGSGFGTDWLDAHLGESLFSVGIALVVSVSAALFGLSLAARKMKPRD